MQRDAAIRKEITEYLGAVERLYPLLQLATSGLQISKTAPDVPEIPVLLLELELAERWGLPDEGTWMDQSVEYMADLEAVRMAREAYKPKPAVDIEGVFASAPPPKPLAGVG